METTYDIEHGYSPDEGGCYCSRPGCGTAEDLERDQAEVLAMLAEGGR